MRSRALRLAFRVVLAMAAVYVVGLGLLFAQQRSLVFPRDERPVSAQSAAIPGLEQVSLKTSDGETLVAWVLPPRGDKPVLLFFHGNSGNLARPLRIERFKALTEDGTGLFAVSYRGYGGSTGRPSEEGLHRDAAAAHEEAARRFGADRLVAYGESLGSGVAVRLAAEARVKALVLEAPYLSALSVAGRRYPFVPARLMMLDPFRSDEVIGRVRVPVLFLHGERDTTVPFAEGAALYNLANPPKRFVRFPDGHHRDLIDQGAIPQVQMFLDDVAAGSLPDTQVRTVGVSKEGS
ncbi:alpha/beta hydrolase [Chelatococcus sp. SYSU_G07232]|uniref:Alpha/beta hydrolase n=1 Tax=Chelatococcus albus TaxID=3047466 RepID=A0ABT7AFX4_9HYPH|nr:alpha/beta hydrolase [Chelatococcus sp. SYSU_G07232]MDJ1158283.1 alpha/beta hydrolase [Chelatococcus sp. SYSU_G07232]